MTEKALRAKVVKVAQSLYGLNEADGSHKKIINIYNGCLPLPMGYQMSYFDAWCAATVSAIGILSDLTDIIFRECSCERMISLYKNVGRWVEDDAYVPQEADIIFYDWNDNGIGDNTGFADHVGMVVAVNGTTIKVIEGNMDNAVGYRSIQVNARYIRGYGIPNYASKATTSSASGSTSNAENISSSNVNTGGNGKMKYGTNNKPLVCMQTNSTCYKNTGTMNVKGILWHSTGANNPWLKRYVQPLNTDSNYNQMINLLGKNQYNNDWNHISVQAGLNAWIGKLADGTVSTVQTMHWNYRPWGCGSGSKGSCNNGFIQFEICEDNLSDKTYFDKVYKEACELTAYLCDMYNLDPHGVTTINGVSVPIILCHNDSYKLGLGTGHADVYHWFNKYGKTMDNVRDDVATLMGKSSTTTTKPSTSTSTGTTTTASISFKVGDEVKLVSGAKYTSGTSIPSWVFKSVLYVREIRSNGDIVISTLKTGAVTGVVASKYLTKYSTTSSSNSFVSYKVKVTADALNIRSGAGTSYSKVGVITNKGVYTIVDEAMIGSVKWGLLKSYEKNRNGWVCLSYAKKV